MACLVGKQAVEGRRTLLSYHLEIRLAIWRA